MNPRRIAVTGATGQVGATLVRRLHDEGHHVVAVARNTLGAAIIHASVPDCDIRVGGLARREGKHLLDDCEVIINCALASSGGNPRAAYARNRELIDGLLDAKVLQWLVHFSTVAIYGELQREFRDERDAFEHPKPTSEYGRSKLYVERYALRRCRERAKRATLLRLGHVYGAGIGRSREIIELARDRSFRLPFDGRFPSNAIHIDRLADAITRHLSSEPRGDTYSFAESDKTWRQVFDWHTTSLGLPAVQRMSDAESARARDVWARASVPREMLAWMRGLPVKRLVRSPAMFDFALRILVKTPNAITSHVTNVNRRVGAKGLVSSALGAHAKTLPVVYVSAGMPGPFLELAPLPASGAGSASESARELREWFIGWSRPKLATARRERQASELHAERYSVAAEGLGAGDRS